MKYSNVAFAQSLKPVKKLTARGILKKTRSLIEQIDKFEPDLRIKAIHATIKRLLSQI